MRAGIENVTTADDYSLANTVRLPGTRRITLQVANAAVVYQLDASSEGKGAWADEIFLAPSIGSLARICSGLRLRSALAGAPAQATVELLDEEGADSLSPFEATVSAAGAITPADTVSVTRLSLASFPPAAPGDGDLVELVVPTTLAHPSTTQVHWFLRYQAADARWYFLGGPPMYARVATSQSNAAINVWQELATTLRLSTPRAGVYRLKHRATMDRPANASVQALLTLGTTAAVPHATVNEGTFFAADAINYALDSAAEGEVTLATNEIVAALYLSTAIVTPFSDRSIELVPVYLT